MRQLTSLKNISVLVGLSGLFVLAFFLRWYHLGLESFWCDEILDYYTSRLDFLSMLADVRIHRGGLPFHYFIQYLMCHIGTSEILLRLPALLFSSLSVVIVYLLGRVVFRSRPAIAWMAALMMALAVFQIRYAQEARFYALFIFLSTTLWWRFFVARKSLARKDWLIYGIIAVMSSYTHYYTFLILLCQGGIVFFPWVIKKIQKSNTRRDNQSVWGVLFCSGAVFVLFIPALHMYTTGTGHYDLFQFSWQKFMVVARLVSGGFLIGMMPLLGGLLFHKEKEEKYNSLWLLLSACFCMVMVLVLDAASGYFFHVRQMIFIQPLVMMLFAAALYFIFEKVPGFLKHIQEETRPWIASLFVLLVLMAVQLPLLKQFYQLPLSDERFAFELKKTEWRQTADFLRLKRQSASAVICLDSLVKKSLDYYFKNMHEQNFPVVEVNYDMGKIDAIFSTNGFQEIWFVDGGIFNGYLQRLSEVEREKLLSQLEWVQEYFRIRIYKFKSEVFPVQTCRSIDIGSQASTIYLGEGWWEDDRTNPGVETLWSRAPYSTLVVPFAKEKPYAIQFVVRASKAQKVKVLVNGQRAAMIEVKPEWQTITSEIKQTLWRDGNNVILFEYEKSERFHKMRKRRAAEWDACHFLFLEE